MLRNPAEPCRRVSQRGEKRRTQTANAETKGVVSIFYCNHCGAELPEGARFCHMCGREVHRKAVCPRCRAELPEGSRFCSFCGAPVSGSNGGVPSGRTTPIQGRPPAVQQRTVRAITIPAPKPEPPAAPRPVPLPASAPIAGISVPAVVNPHDFSGSVQRFFGAGGSRYTFQGTGMYGFLEPFSMNYSPDAGQGPTRKGGGKWFYQSSPQGAAAEAPELEGAQILSSTPDGMYAYIDPTIYFISPDGAMRAFIDAAETLTDLVCYQDWLFVTYLGPFDEMEDPQTRRTVCCDRSYVVVYDRVTGEAVCILERCAGVYYIDSRVIILCDLLDGGEVSRNVYKLPVHGWSPKGFKTLSNYVARIRGSISFSRLLQDACGGRGQWKNTAECTANLRCCSWEHKLLAYQQKGAVVWRDFSGCPAEGPPL